MMLDKQSRSRVVGRRSQTPGRSHEHHVQPEGAEAANRKAWLPGQNRFSMLNRLAYVRFSIRPRWVRLVLLILAVSVLAAIGAAIGRGFGVGAAVVSQAVSPPTAVALLRTASAPGPSAMAQPLATAVARPAIGPTLAPAPAQAQLLAIEASWPALAEERFNSVSEIWPEVRSPSWSSSYQDGGYVIQVDSRSSISYSRPLRSHDFWYGADVRIMRGQAGLFFLIGRPNDFYRFLIDTHGRYQLEWQQVGVSQPLIAWTASDALRRGEGATNQIAVSRRGDELALYANGALLATYALPPGNTLESRIGLALEAPDGQLEGQALFDNLFVRGPAAP